MLEGNGRGASWRMAWAVSNGVVPANGTTPLAISYNITPRAQRSTRASTGWPRRTSGAMCVSVPATDASARIDAGDDDAGSRSIRRDRPKSSTLTCPSGVTATFELLRSRWTMPRR